MEWRKFLQVKQERLIPVSHITQKKILDSLKLDLATKSNPASISGSKSIHGLIKMSLVTLQTAIFLGQFIS